MKAGHIFLTFGVCILAATGGCIFGDFSRTDSSVGGAGGVGGSGAEGGTGGQVGTGGQGAEGGGAGGESPLCMSATFPPGPGPSTPDGDISFVTAVRTATFGTPADPVGFDLDLTCTCDGEPKAGPSCAPPTVASPNCDETDGRDNAFASLSTQLQLLLGVSDLGAFYSSRAEAGEWSALIAIDDYNGELNDEQISLTIYITHGVDDPQWNGQDAWPVSTASLNSDSVDDPKFVDNLAYVTDGVLVGALPTSEIRFVGAQSRLQIKLTAGFITARIEEDGGVYSLRNGVLGGRWAEPDMFASLSAVRDDMGNPFCTNSPIYSNVRDGLCSFRDIHAGVAAPTQPCDATSVGLGFTADPALLGPPEPPLEVTNECDPNFDPVNEVCPPT